MNKTTLHNRNFLLHLQKRDEYDETILLKEPAHNQPSSSHIIQLHNEYIITKQLSEVIGVRPTYSKEGTESKPVVIFEYIPGQSLAELIGLNSLDIIEKLEIAVNVATILSRIHEQNVIHKDINSSNILVSNNDKSGAQGRVYIIDFGLASTLREENPSHLSIEDKFFGTLAYISPEQTGRINRQIDYRSDLYSLGVTLYELFTGQVPFESGDTLEMIHAHIARQPQPPNQINADIPEPVSDIILKLMAKNAEDRYQTAMGLQIDLQHCLDQYQATGQIKLFELGIDDFTGRLQITQKLYGRETEIEQLKAVLDQAILGSAQLLLIAGYSGVGKTALVHEIRKDIIAKHAFFLEGKFDQLNRTLPYSALTQVFTHLVNNWLTESKIRLVGWRKTILEAVGDQGQILIDIIPALEQIIGQQPEVAQLGGLESQNRFNYIFNRFINGLATPEHPLVIFLDDLQWIDPASLNLIESLLTVQSTNCFLIIGAYRNNEVGPDHPLMVSQKKMLSESKPVTTITLEDLAHDDSNQLLADTLQLSIADCRDLSKALVDKTAGNPFYFRQLLYELESDEVLSFDRDRKRWVWKEEFQDSLHAGGNVVDLMIKKIRTLPVESQHTLSMAACLGSRFKETNLHTITGRSQKDILLDLNPALKSGLIFRSDGYFSFAHDRIQEAGYALIPKENIQQTHLEIGRLLLASTPVEEQEDEVFAIVEHLNKGKLLIKSESEKLDLVNLNLRAGQRARNASAFSDAQAHFKIALDLLGSSSWETYYELILTLYNEYGEVTSYLGQYDQITSIADQIHSNATKILDRIRIYMVQINAASATGDFSLSVKIGLNVLDKLGFEIPSQPSSEDHQRLQKRLKELLKGNPNDTISGLPKMTDENSLAASTIIISMMTATFATRPDIYCVIGLTGGILTLEHGVFPWSPHFFGQLGSIFWVAEDHGTPSDHLVDSLLWNKQMQEVVLNMVKDPFFKPSSARALEGVYHNGAFCRPMEKNIELAKKALTTGFEVGDLLFAAHGPFFVAMYGIVTGMNLDKFRSQMIEYIALLRSVNQTIFETWISNYLQAAVNFIEPSEEPQRLVGEYFDEDTFLSASEAANDMTGRHFYYAIKIMVSYHFDEDKELSKLIEESEKFIHAGMGLITVGMTRTYAALSKLRTYPTLTRQHQKIALEIVDHSLQLMEIWSQTAPSTFQHLYDLIRAEKARVTGDTDKALDFYEQAILGANKVGFTNDEALANELYARFFAERGNDRFAGPLMREAHSLYRKWGALAKAEHLSKRYPNLLIGDSIGVNQRGTKTISTDVASDLDLRTVLKASQEIASEIELESLLAKLMDVIIKNAGAQNGFLLLEKGGQWVIEAEGGIENSEINLLQSKDIELSEAVSTGIVNYVARTQDNVILENAANEGDFTEDEIIKQRRAQSVLCTPLINQGKVSGILYLENNLVTSAFTSERVELLNLLSSQMAMALDNAQLYGNLEESEEKFRGVFDSMIDVFTRSDREGKCVIISPSVYNLIGYKPEEIIGKNFTDFYADPEQRKEILNQLQKSESVENFEIDIVRKDGKIITASTNAKMYYNSDGDLLGVEGNIRNITEQKIAENEIMEYQSKLKALANELLVSEEKQRRQIATDLHDHVGQILASSRMEIGALNKSMDKEDILKSINNVSGVLKDGIQATRNAIFNLSPLQLNEIGVAAALSEWMNKELETKYNIKCKLVSDKKIYPLDNEVRYLIFRCVCELLVNVVKHARASEVKVNIQNVSDNILISVEDNGSGFNFNHETHRKKNSGFGLLSIYERIENIEGIVMIDSSKGKGTKAVLKLPINN